MDPADRLIVPVRKTNALRSGVIDEVKRESLVNWAENRLIWILCREPYPLPFDALVEMMGLDEARTRRLLAILLQRKIAKAIRIGDRRRKPFHHVYTAEPKVRLALFGPDPLGR